jgi:hypothetical protein
MERENRNGPMVQSTKANGWKISPKGKGNLFMPMEISMMGSGSPIKQMGKEFMFM